jgi:hypothetical protein
MTGHLTWNALKKYCIAKNGGELYVLLTPDQIAKGQSKAPNGIDWSELIGDFNSLGGNVPLPVNPPTPVPPTPISQVTLAQAEDWAISKFNESSLSKFSKSQIKTYINRGLSTNWPK